MGWFDGITGWMWIFPGLTVVGVLILAYLGLRVLLDVLGPALRGRSPVRRMLAVRGARGAPDDEEHRRRKARLG